MKNNIIGILVLTIILSTILVACTPDISNENTDKIVDDIDNSETGDNENPQTLEDNGQQVQLGKEFTIGDSKITINSVEKLEVGETDKEDVISIDLTWTNLGNESRTWYGTLSDDGDFKKIYTDALQNEAYLLQLTPAHQPYQTQIRTINL